MPVHENLVLNPDPNIAINQLMWIYFIGGCVLFLIALALIVFVLWVKAVFVGLWTGDWTDLYGAVEQKKNEEAIETISHTMESEDFAEEKKNETMEVLGKDENGRNNNSTSDDADDSNDMCTPDDSDENSDVPSLVRDDEDEPIDYDYHTPAGGSSSSVYVREEINGTYEWVEYTFPSRRRSGAQITFSAVTPLNSRQ